MAVPTTLSLTEAQALTTLRSFLLGVLPTPDIEVIRAEINRVPEPLTPNYVVMTPLRHRRLGTNETAYVDDVLVGGIAGATLTVTAITQNEGPLAAGMGLLDKANLVAASTVITGQLSGPPGGIGTYSVVPNQTVAAGTIMYAGTRGDLVETELTVQLDVHGPVSGDNVQIIESLFRSDAGNTTLTGPGYSVAPLYCEDARQVPFEDAEQQTEFRWMLEVTLQINPVVGSQQQFADTLTVTTVEVDTTYPP